MGRMSRNKGKAGERELSRVLRKLYPQLKDQIRRGQQYNGADGSADVIGIPGLHIECKRTEKLNLYKALDQAEDDCPNDQIPVVAHRRNLQPWVLILPLDKLTEFVRVLAQQETGEYDNV